MAQLKKQDKAGARTPAALDRQYNIGGNILSLNKTITKQSKQAETLTKELEEKLKSIITEARVQEMINASIANVQAMVNAAIVDNMLNGTITVLVNQTATKVGRYAFFNHPSIEAVDLHSVNLIEDHAFFGASNLTTVILRSNSLVLLDYADAFEGTPIESGFGYIYVPNELRDSYVNDPTWSTYASKIRSIENYPEICG